MPPSDELADRIRVALEGRDVVEKRMFGGIAFMVSGSMVCGVVGDDLMVRVPADQYEVALGRPHVRVMDFTGRPLTGFVMVAPAGMKSAPALKVWIDEAVAFATSPEQIAKQEKKKAKPKKTMRPPKAVAKRGKR